MIHPLKYKKIINSLLAIVGALHDFGKYNDWFQHKLTLNIPMADSYRHEWVSCKMIEHCYQLYGNEWLDKLADGVNVSIDFDEEFKKNINKLSNDLPTYIKVICYFIVTHHKLVTTDKVSFDDTLDSFDEAFYFIRGNKGFYNKSSRDKIFTPEELEQCYRFSKGNVLGKKTRELINQHKDVVKNYDFDKLVSTQQFHMFTYYTRACLMLADYNISASKEAKALITKKSKIAWANKNDIGFCQTVDEHCYLVAKKALQISNILYKFIGKLPSANNDFLNKKSPKAYEWQDKAVAEIKKYPHAKFFCINMASTGKGKTIANAKIANAMSKDLRYTLAVGLRTLVLQTGRSYTSDINFSQEDVSICIGNESYKKLFDINNGDYLDNNENADSIADIEGEFQTEELMHDQNGFEMEFDSIMSDTKTEFLNDILKERKFKAFLGKPITVCTIDYLMRITQVKKGGKHIMPFLRMLSSDLIIDEVDDFGINDLKAIQQLVYITGMCGRNFIMSSATIPPNIARGFYKAYTEGLAVYNSFFNKPIPCVTILCDEFGTTSSLNNFNSFVPFIDKRIKNIMSAIVKRRGAILPLKTISKELFFDTIEDGLFKLHHANSFDMNGHNVSFGCIRVANVNTCVAVTEQLLALRKKDYTIKVLCYHSRQIMLLRNELEVYLQKVLNRKHGIKDALVEDIVENGEKNVIFIVVSTPIEEVGRDHDFDWSIIEPSSVRSIIQMGGRVLRHRNLSPKGINIGILQYNYAYITKKYHDKKYFRFPGVESNVDIKMGDYDVTKLGLPNIIHNITSEPVINYKYNDKHKSTFTSLIEAEHYQASKVNDFSSEGAGFIHGFTNEYWYLMENVLHFREQQFTTENCIVNIHSNSLHFEQKIKDKFVEFYTPTFVAIDETNLWIKRDYIDSILDLQVKTNENINTLTEEFGSIGIVINSKHKYYYNDNLGFYHE